MDGELSETVGQLGDSNADTSIDNASSHAVGHGSAQQSIGTQPSPSDAQGLGAGMAAAIPKDVLIRRSATVRERLEAAADECRPATLMGASAAEVRALCELMREDWHRFNEVQTLLVDQQSDAIEEAVNRNCYGDTATSYRRALARCQERLQLIANLDSRQRQLAISSTEPIGAVLEVQCPETLRPNPETINHVALGTRVSGPEGSNGTPAVPSGTISGMVAPNGGAVPHGGSMVAPNGGAALHCESGGYWKFPVSRFPDTKFSGDRTQWVTFKSRVATMQYYTAIDRYHKLTSMLSGEAAAVLDGVTVTTAIEYQQAWDLLCNRFDDVHELMRKHFEKFMALPTAQEGTASELHSLVDGAKAMLRAWSSLQVENGLECAMMLLLEQRLDTSTLQDWYRKEREPNRPPTLDQWFSFVTSRARGAALAPTNAPPPGQGDWRERARVRLAAACLNCPACNQGHALEECPEFLAMRPNIRRDAVRRWRLCYNCLQPGHAVRECEAVTCSICAGEHHEVLCFPRKEDGWRLGPHAPA